MLGVWGLPSRSFFFLGLKAGCRLQSSRIQICATYKVMRLDGILQCQRPKPMYAVLFGAARYVNCYHGVKSAPNAQWQLDVPKGPNPGSMTARKFAA